MLKLSLDSTNSINICQEEIYHLTTAGNKVFLPLLSFLSLSSEGWHCDSNCWSIFIKCHRGVDGNMISFQYLLLCSAYRLLFSSKPDISFSLLIIRKMSLIISQLFYFKEKSYSSKTNCLYFKGPTCNI